MFYLSTFCNIQKQKYQIKKKEEKWTRRKEQFTLNYLNSVEFSFIIKIRFLPYFRISSSVPWDGKSCSAMIARTTFIKGNWHHDCHYRLRLLYINLIDFKTCSKKQKTKNNFLWYQSSSSSMYQNLPDKVCSSDFFKRFKYR